MASVTQWIEGVRPRTLPAAVAPVLAGAAVAASRGVRHWGIVVLCLAVTLALQIGVNLANDYSDGIRGTDAERVGPLRLVGSGAASASSVRNGALVAFGMAAVAGLVIVVLSGHWWLLAVGVASIVAAWHYTGGKRPYGYMGLGEVFVFVFFGLVAVGGTTYVLLGSVPLEAWVAAVCVGLLACAILVANNLRDIVSDREARKFTLATRLGDHRTRILFVVMIAVSFVLVAWLGLSMPPFVLVALLGLVPAALACVRVARGARGRDLIGVLQLTGIAELAVGLGLLAGTAL